MKYDIILSGVGGQGVLSLAAVIATAAAGAGYKVRQSEVHGMAQRGGAVMAHMRISDGEIYSDLIGKGTADMVLSMEPLESLRYLTWLSPKGVVVTSTNPVENIPNYPDMGDLEQALEKIEYKTLVDDKSLSKEAGSSRAGNMVIVGAASAHLPLEMDHLKAAVESLFARKGEQVVQTNYTALELGSRIG